MSRKSTCASSVRTDAVSMSNGRLSWVLSVFVGAAVAFSPTGSVSSPPSSLTPPSGRAQALLRGEEDVDPGAVDLSNPAVRLG